MPSRGSPWNKMIYAIVCAAGSGTRMGAQVPKQYIEINEKPLLFYTLRALENSCIDRIVIVADESHLSFVVSDIVERYGFCKVIQVCSGGKERFDSVFHGLDAIREEASEEDLVLIHDGARPFVQAEEIANVVQAVQTYGAAIAASPVQDTIKVSDAEGFVAATTIRKQTWQVQTPQGFIYGQIRHAYQKAASMHGDQTAVFTDDAMVLEAVFPQKKIKLVKTSGENRKITTAADLALAKKKLF